MRVVKYVNYERWDVKDESWGVNDKRKGMKGRVGF